MSSDDNRQRMAALESQIKKAREQGALYHPTNPHDAWYCIECSVFGRGQLRCWSCDGPVHAQWVPRMGGGAQSVIHEPEPPQTKKEIVTPYTGHVLVSQEIQSEYSGEFAPMFGVI